MKKALKILSVLMIIGAVILVMVSILSLASGGLLGVAGMESRPVTEDEIETADAAFILGSVIVILGILLLITAIFNLITGIFGLRGAKGDAAAAGKSKVMACISLAITIISDVIMLATGEAEATNALSMVLGIALSVCFIYIAYRVQHEDASNALED